MGVGGCFFGLSATTLSDFIIIWIGIKGGTTIARFHTIKGNMPLVFDEPLRYPAPVQMSGEELGVNTHRVFSLFKCLVIIDLTPTLMLEKVGSGVEAEVEGEGELHPPIFFYLICFQHRFSGFGKIPTRIQLHLCPTTVLMFQWLFSKVGFAEGVTWSTLFLHLHFEGLGSSGCSPTTHRWSCFGEFLPCFTWIAFWTIFLQPLGGVERGRCIYTHNYSRV